MEESFEGRAKDCSKGFGSRSKLERFGRVGGRCEWGLSISSWVCFGGEGGEREAVEEDIVEEKRER